MTTYYSAMTRWSTKEDIRRELMEVQQAGCWLIKRMKTPGKSSMSTIPTSPWLWRIKTNFPLEFILGLRQTILAPWARLSGWFLQNPSPYLRHAKPRKPCKLCFAYFAGCCCFKCFTTGCFRITVKSKTQRNRPLFDFNWFFQSFLDSILWDILIF